MNIRTIFHKTLAPTTKRGDNQKNTMLVPFWNSLTSLTCFLPTKAFSVSRERSRAERHARACSGIARLPTAAYHVAADAQAFRAHVVVRNR